MAQRIKPRFLYDPLRGIATYESILVPFGISAPLFYGSVIDQSRGRYWLFLERVSAPPLTEIGEFDVWLPGQRLAGADALSRRARSRSGARRPLIVPLVRYDRAHFRLWIERARATPVRRHADLDRAACRFDWLASRYEAVVEEIAALPTGFVHGEFFASNVLVEAAADNVRVRPLDWERAGIGPALLDLAALTAGTLDRGRADRAGRCGITPSSIRKASLASARGASSRGLDCCRLGIAMQHIGWAKQWTPPATHTQDWFGEALHAADRIGL